MLVIVHRLDVNEDLAYSALFQKLTGVGGVVLNSCVLDHVDFTKEAMVTGFFPTLYFVILA